jgi:predicted DNA-binding transcriptional regulator YafY
MARGELILRQWNLLKMLQTRGEGMPLRDIADAFEVSERTVQRDFEVLQELGFPIEYEEDEFGKRFWRLPHDFFRTGPLVVGITEAISLHLAEKMLDPLAGTMLAEGLQSMLEKIRSLVPAKALDYFAELDNTVHVRRLGTTDYTAHADAIRVLLDNARKEVTVNVAYRSLWRKQAYATHFDPYGLVIFDGDLFVLGRSHRAADLRILKIARITSVEPTTEVFERPTDFRLADHFRASFGIVHTGGEPVEVVARFSGSAAALVSEREWHESQQLAWLDAEATLFDEVPDEPEAVLATFQLGNTVEFKKWIKGFGAEAEVVRPDWLREELRNELLAAARRYDA